MPIDVPGLTAALAAAFADIAPGKGAAAATASGTQEIAHGLGVAPRLVLVIASDDATPAVLSNGWAAGSALSVFTGSTTSGARTGIKAIDIRTASGDGHSADVSAVDAAGFTLNWTKVGHGRAITVRWVALG